MKNKLTLSLAITTLIIAFISCLLIVLAFAGYDQTNKIVKNLGWNNNFEQEFITGAKTSIPLTIFSALSLIISGFAILAHWRMDNSAYEKWFYIAIVTSLGMSFGTITEPLWNDIASFRRLSDLKAQAIPTVADDPSLTPDIILKIVRLKDLSLILAYTFPLKALTSASSCLVLIASVIYIARIAGFDMVGTTNHALTKAKTSGGSKKLDRSLDMVIKAKSLYDSGALSKNEFDKIKERELSL